MSVYTLINRSQFESLLAYYDIGELESYSPIKSGTINSNYVFTTLKDSVSSKYVLTIVEDQLSKSEIELCLKFASLLKNGGLPAAAAIVDRHNNYYHKLVNKNTIIAPFIKGESLFMSIESGSLITPEHCSQLGATLAQMHCIGLNINESRANPLSLEQTYISYENIIDELPNDTVELLADEFKYFAENQHAIKKVKPLSGVVHSDLFTDNILFHQGKLHGIIDFFNVCTDYLLYDLAVVINDWTITPNGSIVHQNYEALLSTYVNTLKQNSTIYDNITDIIKNHSWVWNYMLRRAALTFWILRLKANVEINDDGELNTVKNPTEYEVKLILHQNAKLEFFNP